MKKLLLAGLLVLPSLSFASEGLLNFNEIWGKTRIGKFVDQHLEDHTGIYYNWINYHDKSLKKVTYVSLNVGYIPKLDPRPTTPLLQVGVRVDNVIARAIDTEWGRAHLSVGDTPTIEFGPFVSGYVPRGEKFKIVALYGFGIAVGFSKD